MQQKRLHCGKAAGPDSVSKKTLKGCAEQLCGVFQKQSETVKGFLQFG